jgi:hypothetical protein
MEKKKNVLNDLCLVPNPGPGPDEVEAIFYHNLKNVGGKWQCEVILVDSRINDARLITIEYEKVSFLNDDDNKRWRYYIELEEKTARKELARERQTLINLRQKIVKTNKSDLKKIIAERTFFLN